MPKKHIQDEHRANDIVQTGKRYGGYGVGIQEYCKRIGISLSRWYRMAKTGSQELSPQGKRKVPKNPYALTEEEKGAIVTYAIAHPQYYHREMAYRMVDEGITCTSPSTVYRILRKHGLIGKNVHTKRYGWVHRYSNQADSPDQLWQADITYVKYRDKDVYQVSYIDVYSRFVVFSATLTSMDGKTVSKVFERYIKEYGDSLI